MFCPKCAAQNIEGASFCRVCGANISLVPQALTGQIVQTPPPEEVVDESCSRRGRRRELTLDVAFKNMFLGIANYEQFQLGVSVDYLAMIIIGGLGSVQGSIFGAFFITLLPIVIRRVMEAFGGVFFEPQTVLNLIPNVRVMLFGVLIIFFLIVEPEGLNRLWRNIRSYFRVWPFAY